jgi:plastocyanin
MLTNFDSRALGLTDAYGQRFMREGTYRYDVVIAGCGGLTSEYPYSVLVSEGSEDMMQHTVMLSTDDGKLRPDAQELNITIGDLVTWACREPSAPPFEVLGAHEFFTSARLSNESGYAHAFGTAGEYVWVDAYGSGLRGTVHVVDPDCVTKEEFAAWQAGLATGQLVMITGNEADPAEVEIMTGQTVYFAVTKAPGISISDPRLIFPPSRGHSNRPKKGQAAV